MASSGTPAAAAAAGNGVTTAPGQSPSHAGGSGAHRDHRGVQRSISASSKQRRGSTGAEANSVIGKTMISLDKTPLPNLNI